MLKILSYTLAMQQRLTSRARSLALDATAIFGFLRVALRPSGALGQAYRAETRGFLFEQGREIALASAARFKRALAIYLAFIVLFFVISSTLLKSSNDVFVALPLSGFFEQNPPCSTLIQLPKNTTTPTLQPSWDAQGGSTLSALARSAGSATVVVSDELYSDALRVSQLASNPGSFKYQFISVDRPALNQADALKAKLSFHAQCVKAARLFYSARTQSAPTSLRLPISAAFAKSLAPGAGALDFRAAAMAELSRAKPSAIPIALLANAMDQAMNSQWQLHLSVFRSLSYIFILYFACFIVLSFLWRAGLLSANFLSRISDPAIAARLNRAELLDETSAPSTRPSHPARRL